MAQDPRTKENRLAHQQGLDALNKWHSYDPFPFLGVDKRPIATDPQGKRPRPPELTVDEYGRAVIPAGGLEDTARDLSYINKTPGQNPLNSDFKNYVQNLAHPAKVSSRVGEIATHAAKGAVGDLGRATWLASGQYQNDPNVFGDASLLGDTIRGVHNAVTDPVGTIKELGSTEGGLADIALMTTGGAKPVRSAAHHIPKMIRDPKLYANKLVGKYPVYHGQHKGGVDLTLDRPSLLKLRRAQEGKRPAGIFDPDPYVEHLPAGPSGRRAQRRYPNELATRNARGLYASTEVPVASRYAGGHGGTVYRTFVDPKNFPQFYRTKGALGSVNMLTHDPVPVKSQWSDWNVPFNWQYQKMLKESAKEYGSTPHGTRWWDHENATPEDKWSATSNPTGKNPIRIPYKDMPGTKSGRGETHVITNQLPSYKWEKVDRDTGKPKPFWKKELTPEPYKHHTFKEQSAIKKQERATGKVYDPVHDVWK